MKETKLGSIQTKTFDEFLFIGFDKKWLLVNDGKSIEFETKLTKDGKLELCANLSKLSHSSKEVDTNVK